MRRGGILFVLAALVTVGAPPATAYWRAGGTGSGQAPVDTVAGASRPIVAVSAAAVTVEWTQTTFQGRALGSFGGGGYTVVRYPAAGGPAVTPNAGCGATVSGADATLSCQESSVPPGAWRYAVTPVLGSWTGAPSSQSAAVAIAPTAPTLTVVNAQNPVAGQSTGNIRVEWSAVTGASGYNLYRRAGSGAYDLSAPLNGAVLLTTTTYTDPGAGLASSTTYAYVVRAVSAGVESASSSERSAIAIGRPSAPASATATLRAGARIDIGWASVEGASGYNVYRRTSTGAYDYSTPLNGATTATGTSYSDTTATDGVTYAYVVRAVVAGAGGVQVESTDSPETAAARADGTPPTAVSLTDPGSPLRGAITLSGVATDTGSGVASLRFQYVAAGGSTWTDVCTDTSTPYACTLTTTTLADGLYDLRVVAADAAGNATTSSLVAGRRVDNTAPAATMNDPGQYLRATVTLTATASDAGSGLASLRIQRAATGSSTWTDVCTAATSPASCPLTTTTLSDGGYDLRAIATDQAGNTATSAAVANRTVDNTVPRGVDVQATNGAASIVGRPGAGDVVTFTFSEPMRPASILASWTGTATSVTVRMSGVNPNLLTVYNAANTSQLPLGSLNTGRRYVTSAITFPSSTMALAANAISVTLGTPSATPSTQSATGTLQWTTSTAATDLAGNPLTAATIAETGTVDTDF